MNGTIQNSKREIVNRFIKEVKPYETKKPFFFDMRGYNDYLKKNNLPRNCASPEIVNRFLLNK